MKRKRDELRTRAEATLRRGCAALAAFRNDLNMRVFGDFTYEKNSVEVRCLQPASLRALIDFVDFVEGMGMRVAVSITNEALVKFVVREPVDGDLPEKPAPPSEMTKKQFTDKVYDLIKKHQARVDAENEEWSIKIEQSKRGATEDVCAKHVPITTLLLREMAAHANACPQCVDATLIPRISAVNFSFTAAK